MKLEDFDYELPESLIAAYPREERTASRMLMLNREKASITHQTVRDLPELLREGDLLVVNDTRVVPARLHGHKDSGGKIEVLFTEEVKPGCWNALLKSSRRPKPGTPLHFPNMVATFLKEGQNGGCLIQVPEDINLLNYLEKHGEMPLPPYMQRQAEAKDRERYQTVYANKPGAVAAPTAGLHLSETLIHTLRNQGITLAPVTLHVGPGTFQPVQVDRIDQHTMHEEWYEVPETTALEVEQAKKEGRRIIAIGTTSVRTLESASPSPGVITPGSSRTQLFIYPGYPFNIIDGMLTNFHLPRSTLIMLVAAFAGKDFLLDAYQEAVQASYRFYSYGDCMLVM